MSNSSLTILVTGVSGDLGQAIIKCLRLMDRPVQVLGCDMVSESTGRVFVDKLFEVPSAESRAYLKRIEDICKKNNVHAVIPSSEPEMIILSKLGIPPRVSCGAAVICQSYSCIELYGDKLKCFRALQDTVKLAPYADASCVQDVEEILASDSYPYVVKPRFSTGGKGFKIAWDKKQLLKFIDDAQGQVIQQYFDDAGGEFSVGVFSSDDFMAMIAFRRQLGPGGASWFANNFDQDHEVLEYAKKIAEFTRLSGSYNIQVRKSSNGVRLLEINSRFSSLAAARAACGFKDVEWSILTALKLKVEPPLNGYKSIRFRRYLHEVIDFGTGYTGIREWLPRHIALKMNED